MGNPSTNIHICYRQQVQTHHRILAELAHRYTPAGQVLDVGCGLGFALAELHRLNPALRLSGADMDAICLEQTTGRVPGVTTRSMRPGRFDVESLGDGYDTVMMSHVLEHLPHPTRAVERLLGIVQPGGHLILGVPNPVTPRSVIATTLRRPAINPGHVHAWDRRHWINFLEHALQLQVVEYQEDEVRVFPERWRRSVRWLGAIQRKLRHLAPWWSHTQFAVIPRPGV